MGQAVVDLPDPLEQPPAGASGADDLLSQLAGDEIDRLLTEADVDNADAPAIEPAQPLPADPILDATAAHTTAADSSTTSTDPATPAAPASAAHPATAATSSREPAAAPLAALRTDAAPESSAAADAAVAPAAASSAALPGTAASMVIAGETPVAAAGTTADASPAITSAEVNTVLAPTAPAEAAAAAEAPAVSKADLDQALADNADHVLPPHTAELRAEAAALEPKAEPALLTEREGLLAEVAAESTDEDLGSPLPLWLRPLEWLNAPLEALSDTARELLGKAAILTLVNSIAVILYVLIWRKH